NLQSYIQTTMPLADVWNVIGGRRIDLSFSPVPSPSLPYPSTIQYAWKGDIPDQFSTQFSVQFYDNNQSFYADEVAGERLRVYDPIAFSGSQVSPYLEDTVLASTSCFTCATVPVTEVVNGQTLTYQTPLVTFHANHPYSALGGAYGDE